MNLKTTLVLLILVVAGGALFWVGPALPPWLATPAQSSVDLGTRDVLEKEVVADKLRRIEIKFGDRTVVFERGGDGQWTLPGKWPTRQREVDELVRLLGALHPRFAALPLGQTLDDIKSYGLEPPAVVVKVRTDSKEFQLAFGEEPATANRFSRATFLRLDARPEVVRLGPGLVGLLGRPAEYYMQRRLFPVERVTREGGTPEKVDRLKAEAITLKDADGTLTLQVPKDAKWIVTEPVRDRVDPDKLNALLDAGADVWAERFVASPKKDLAEYGLDKPEKSIQVTTQAGERPIRLLIGKESGELKRLVNRPAPPFPGAPPTSEVVVEKLRYAKLENNDQVFEIRDKALGEVFVKLDDLRDSRLARFGPGDAVRIEMTQPGGGSIVLVKADGKWKMEKPAQFSAETAKVLDLVDKLANLRAGGKDIDDKADLKALGLDPPAGKVVVDVEQEKKGDGKAKEKEKEKRTVTFHLGKHDAEQKKLSVRVDDWPRVNSVDDAVLKEVNRPAVAYRTRTLFDFAAKDIDAIEVQRAGEKYLLKQKDGVWKLASPVEADADVAKARQLADDLARLVVVEHIAAEPKADELEKDYGIGKDALVVTLTFAEDLKKPAETFRIGKARGGKEEFFAKVDSAPGVFVVSKELRDQFDRASLAYRPVLLWQVAPAEVAELKILRKGEPEYRLIRDGKDWKIAGPFDAPVAGPVVQRLLEDVAPLRADRYEAQAVKDLKPFGLDDPSVRVILKPLSADKDKEAPERVLLLGSATKDGPAGRFAKLAGGDAVFVVNFIVATTLDVAALELLDHKLLTLDPRSIVKVQSSAGDQKLVLEKKNDEWQVTSAAPAFTADRGMVEGVLTVCAGLRADRFADYGKIDPAKYGLDKPSSTVTITVQPAEGKPVEHTLLLGGLVKEPGGPRFARLKDGPGVAVLHAGAVAELSRTRLDFADRNLLRLDAGKVSALVRKMGDQQLEIARKDDGWQITKPDAARADDPTLDRLVKELAGLRAVRVAAFPAKELKAYGLDDPAALITLRIGEGDKAKEHVVKIGETADLPGSTAGDRFVQVQGSDTVGVLPGALVRQLVAKPLFFRDHAVARFPDADRIVLETGLRRAVFTRVDGNWKLTDPVQADAEQTGLDEFINSVARLRADELVADKSNPTADDLKPFGLDKSETTWRFFQGDKEVLALQVGTPLKSAPDAPPRLHAKLASSDLVFLLTPKVASQVQAEYRSRALWPPVDIVQAEQLEYKEGKTPFTLEKAGAEWKVAGKPDVKVRTEAVNETLAALAALKCEKTVVDKDADLKLFGLDPPQLVVELRTRTGGKRTLHIGRQEGDSKRCYARVADGNRADVFILSEADAAKVVRELTEFVGKKP